MDTARSLLREALTSTLLPASRCCRRSKRGGATRNRRRISPRISYASQARRRGS